MEFFTIHFHLKHFKESGLSNPEYMMLLLYEQKTDWLISEIREILPMGERTVARTRNSLVSRGYLEKIKGNGVFRLTDKLYK